MSERDWTVNPKTGRSNDSEMFNGLCEEVERLIRDNARMLLAGRADQTARAIVALLAHTHKMAPTRRRKARKP